MESVDYLEDLPETDEPAWILGRQHHLKTEKSKLLSDIGSCLWFTYRRKFSPIGGTGPSSDAGSPAPVCVFPAPSPFLPKEKNLVCRRASGEPESKNWLVVLLRTVLPALTIPGW
uniref:Cysteine protease n=1 Tax=Micrurus surinamensis TaxID=129470 RepID=A0A2D4PVU3_MICSU